MNNNITDGVFDIVFNQNLLNSFLVVDINDRKTLILRPGQSPKLQVEFSDEIFDEFMTVTTTPGIDKEQTRFLTKFTFKFLNQFWSWPSETQTDFITLMTKGQKSPDDFVNKQSSIYLLIAEMGLRLQTELVGTN